MQLLVGLGAHRGGINRYPFDILELPISPSLPKPKTLKEMRQARPALVYSLRLHPDVVQTGISHPDVERTCVARDVLGARVVVVPTGPRFTPTDANRSGLSALAERLRHEGCDVAWEPRGVFAPREAERWASETGVLLVRDLTREAAFHDGVIYTRLPGLGLSARISEDSAELLAGQLEGAELAIVIVGGEGAKLTRQRLRDLLEIEEQPCDDT